jgi:hypothetical protein
MKEHELKILKQELGLSHLNAPDELRTAVSERFASMNSIQLAEVKMRIGRKVREVETMSHGDKYSPKTWSLLAASSLFGLFAAGGIIVIIRTDLWVVLKAVVGVLTLGWFLVGCQGWARVIFRTINQRDW